MRNVEELNHPFGPIEAPPFRKGIIQVQFFLRLQFPNHSASSSDAKLVSDGPNHVWDLGTTTINHGWKLLSAFTSSSLNGTLNLEIYNSGKMFHVHMEHEHKSSGQITVLVTLDRVAHKSV